MLNKYKIISLVFFVFLVLIPSMAQTSKRANPKERARVERPKEQVRKPSVRKPAARKPAARKPAAKKPTARKPAARKPVAKKSAIKEETVKEETVKKEAVKEIKTYLPEAGDFSIGISATPVLNFVGNMFNGTIGQIIGSDLGGGSVLQPFSSGAPTVSIMGKYMKSDKVAFRANIGFILGMNKVGCYVQDDAAGGARIKDYKTTMSRGGSVSLGIERRVGKNRIQGFFSVSALYSLVYSEDEYEYGNIITENNQRPTIGDDREIIPNYVPISNITSARVLKQIADGSSNTAGLVAGVGIEWFIAPKISIGAEVNLAALYAWSGAIYTEYEGYSTTEAKVVNYTSLTGPPTTAVKIGTLSADLSVNFFF